MIRTAFSASKPPATAVIVLKPVASSWWISELDREFSCRHRGIATPSTGARHRTADARRPTPSLSIYSGRKCGANNRGQIPNAKCQKHARANRLQKRLYRCPKAPVLRCLRTAVLKTDTQQAQQCSVCVGRVRDSRHKQSCCAES